MLAGAFRLSQLASGAAESPENARFLASPVPITAHVLGATLFTVLGALQLTPSQRRPRWHRVVGRVVVPAGLVAALSGLWMTLLYPLPVGQDHPLLQALRLVLGLGMALALALGLVAILRRDFAAHRAWMVRSYAIGLGAGTQALILIPCLWLFGKPTGLAHALLMGAGWALNLVVAERHLHRA